MGTIVIICAVVVAGWCAAACVVAVVVSRCIRIADQRQREERIQSQAVRPLESIASTALRR